MSELYVDLAVLSDIAGELDLAADGLDGLAGSVPGGVDAGPMTAVINVMLAQVTDSAANVSESLTASAALVRLCRRYYQQADADADAGLSEIREAMEG
ncbi:hypothetical protein [Nocardioides ferulae]|uniref:hypothetical protein n=1 Tax=Nocardioides ferulae TaxID=2340821 RepID=UPI000EB21D86|nr:hypothetical protein [Nocardioides ferulae]